MQSEIFSTIHKHAGLSFDNFDYKSKSKKLKKSIVNYSELFYQVKRAIFLTKQNISVDDNKQSIFIYGPTGIGKTQIIQDIANKTDCVYHKLEIQKVPIEELQGFPYLFNGKDGKTYVRLAHPTVLPPSNDDRLWILHLDEFNKAETENMAAVMNLILTGEIGGSADYDEESGRSLKYSLPKKTVIIGTGNKKSQKNTSSYNTVNRFDIATAERWHRNLFLEYDAFSWIESFAFKPFMWNGITLPSRILNIILYYIFDKAMEENKQSPFLISKLLDKDNSEDFSGDSTMSPRAWTLLSDNMLFDIWLNWNNLKKSDHEKYSNKAEELDLDSGFAAYTLDPNVQVNALLNNVYELGITGDNLVLDIKSRFEFFSDNRVLPTDIIYDYVSFRASAIKMKERKGALLYLLLGIANAVNDMEELELKPAALNISTFIADTNIPAEDISAFIYELNKSKKELNDILYSINERYKNAYEGFYYTSSKEFENVEMN